MNWYFKVIKQYNDFTGRSGRKEFWTFVLFNILLVFALGFIDAIIGTSDAKIEYGFLSGFYTLAVLVPFIALLVRRLQDVGESGWMILIAFIPFVGAIWLIVLCLKDGNPGEKQYGPNPKKISDI
jgi:uncharacterized membrane protein YhaH (DUF805 family)